MKKEEINNYISNLTLSRKNKESIFYTIFSNSSSINKSNFNISNSIDLLANLSSSNKSNRSFKNIKEIIPLTYIKENPNFNINWNTSNSNLERDLSRANFTPISSSINRNINRLNLGSSLAISSSSNRLSSKRSFSNRESLDSNNINIELTNINIKNNLLNISKKKKRERPKKVKTGKVDRSKKS